MSKLDIVDLTEAAKPRRSRVDIVLGILAVLAIQAIVASTIFSIFAGGVSFNGQPLGVAADFLLWFIADGLIGFGYALHWVISHD
jgi:hypothetical protein